MRIRKIIKAYDRRRERIHKDYDTPKKSISWSTYWATRKATSFKAETVSGTAIDLTWNNNGPEDYDGYYIYASIDNGLNYNLLDTIAILESYSATGLIPNTLYLFKLVGYKGVNLSNQTPITATCTNINDALVAGWKMDYPDEFQNNLSHIAFWSMHNSSAQYFNGVTYVCYQGDDDDPYIITYTHATGLWSAAVQVGVNPISDDQAHTAPTMTIDSSGYIHVIYGVHNGEPPYKRSANPEDISTWDTITTTGFDGSYYTLIQLSNDDIYMFYRQEGVPYQWGYRISSDGGDTWGVFIQLTAWFSYLTFRKGTGDVIHCSGNGFETTDYPRYDIFYMYFSDGTWKNKAGTTLSLPIPLYGDDIKIYDSGANYISMTLPGIDSNNNPYILFTEGADETAMTFKILKYISGAWNVITIGADDTLFENYATAIDVISDTHFDIYLIVGLIIIGGRLEQWSTYDAGLTWSKVRTIRMGANVRPIVVKNHHADAKLAFATIDSTITYINKCFLWGDSGFLKNASLVSANITEVKSLYDGTITGSVPVLGVARSFDGSNGNYIKILDNDVFSFTTGAADLPFSITHRINLGSTTGTQSVFMKRTGVPSALAEWWIDILNTGIYRFNLVKSDISAAIDARAPFTVTGSAIFMCVTFTPGLTPVQSGIKIYKDCLESQTSQNVSGTYPGMTNTVAPIYVGANYLGQSPMTGLIWDIKIWNKVLTPTEMALEMANTL